MRIFVVGNINVGKTYVVDKLKSIFSNYTVISIDEYRRKYGDGSFQQELHSRDKFVEDILKSENCIVEYSGGKTITDMFIDDLPNNSFLVLEVNESVDVCLERIGKKDFSKTPYPVFSESIEDTIKRLDHEYRSGVIDANFQDKYLKKFYLHSSEPIESLPLYQYELAIQVAGILKNHGDYLISYGSMARDQMTKFSDIDLFLISKESVHQILDIVVRSFPQATKVLVQKNQIDLYYKDQLMELTVVKEISDIKRFFSTGKIVDVKKTLLFGDLMILPILTDYKTDNQDDFWDEFEFTMARLEYYCKSMFRIIPKNDAYKFFFHNNIIIHEYLRLSYFLAGKKDFSYLPKSGIDYIGEEVFRTMTFTLGSDMKEHSMKMMDLSTQLLIKAKAYHKTKSFLSNC